MLSAVNLRAIMVVAIMVRILIDISIQGKVMKVTVNYARMMASKLVTRVLGVRN